MTRSAFVVFGFEIRLIVLLVMGSIRWFGVRRHRRPVR